MTERMRLLSHLLYDLVGAIQGSQIWQTWRIFFITEVTEGVTSTPKIFGNKLGATSTPEPFCPYIFRNKYNLR